MTTRNRPAWWWSEVRSLFSGWRRDVLDQRRFRDASTLLEAINVASRHELNTVFAAVDMGASFGALRQHFGRNDPAARSAAKIMEPALRSNLKLRRELRLLKTRLARHERKS